MIASKVQASPHVGATGIMRSPVHLMARAGLTKVKGKARSSGLHHALESGVDSKQQQPAVPKNDGHVSIKLVVHLEDRPGVDVDAKTGLVGMKKEPRLVPQDRDRLSVYAFVSSNWMRYPFGDHTRTHTFPISSVSKNSTVVIETSPVVPENVWLHLTLVSAEKDERNLRVADVELGRATVELRQVCAMPMTIKIYSVFDTEWDLGTFTVRLHPESKKTNQPLPGMFSVPEFKGLIPRVEPRVKRALADAWISANYQAVWGEHDSRIYYPNGSLFRAVESNDSVPTEEGRIPMLFYLYHASRFEAENPTEFADALIRLGCLRAGIAPSKMLQEPAASTVPMTVLCYALNGLPLALGYCSDMRGSAYTFPVASDSISRTSGMCVEFSTLVTVAARAIRAGTSKLCRRMQVLLGGFRVCTAMCTSRAGGLVMTSTDMISRHLTALLVPDSAFKELARPFAEESNSKARYTSYMIDALEEVQPSPLLPTPGSLSAYEPYVLRGILPYTMRPEVTFDLKGRDGIPGPAAFYRSVMKLYWTEGEHLMEYSCFTKQGSEYAIGIEMAEIVCRGMCASEHRLFCPKPLTTSSQEILAFEPDFQETLHLTNLYQNLSSPVYLSDNMAEKLAAMVSSLPRGTGWRYGFYVMREKQDVGLLQQYLQKFTARASELAVEHPWTGITEASASVLDLVNITGDALSACVLLTYSTDEKQVARTQKPTTASSTSK
jgi:hypothetical protein